MDPKVLNTLMMFLPILIIFVSFYFFAIKPEKKRQVQVLQMQKNLQKNDKIVTIGGLHGIIDDVKDDVVTITVASGARIKVEKSAIRRIITND